MARYMCECYHCIKDISDVIEVYAIDMAEAVEMACREFSGRNHECIEDTSCRCKLIEPWQGVSYG